MQKILFSNDDPRLSYIRCTSSVNHMCIKKVELSKVLLSDMFVIRQIYFSPYTNHFWVGKRAPSRICSWHVFLFSCSTMSE